jgi:hypothetical protein
MTVATGLLASAALAAGAGTGTARAADSLITGTLWSGYVTTQGQFYSASADFTVPGATCLPGGGGYIYYWVGFQNNGGIVQDGFTVSCQQGQQVNEAWYTQNSDAPIYINQPVEVNDLVSVSAICGYGFCTQAVRDVTQNWSDTTFFLEPANAGAGWIAAIAAEAYNGGVETSPVQVTNATFNGTPIGQFNPSPEEQRLAASGAAAGLDPSSPLESTGTAFAFSWNGDPYGASGRSGCCWAAAAPLVLHEIAGSLFKTNRHERSESRSPQGSAT